MIAANNDLEFLLSYFENISDVKPVSITIYDAVEGDMKLTFKLCIDNSDNNSYTKLSVIDKYNADVLIFNALDDKEVSPSKYIQVGTYMHKFYLSMYYKLFKKSENGNRMLYVKLYKQLISDHGSI